MIIANLKKLQRDYEESIEDNLHMDNDQYSKYFEFQNNHCNKKDYLIEKGHSLNRYFKKYGQKLLSHKFFAFKKDELWALDKNVKYYEIPNETDLLYFQADTGKSFVGLMIGVISMFLCLLAIIGFFMGPSFLVDFPAGSAGPANKVILTTTLFDFAFSGNVTLFSSAYNTTNNITIAPILVFKITFILQILVSILALSSVIMYFMRKKQYWLFTLLTTLVSIPCLVLVLMSTKSVINGIYSPEYILSNKNNGIDLYKITKFNSGTILLLALLGAGTVGSITSLILNFKKSRIKS